MALIKCPECGKDVSDKSKVCIHCGYPFAEENSSENEAAKTEGNFYEAPLPQSGEATEKNTENPVGSVTVVETEPVPEKKPAKKKLYKKPLFWLGIVTAIVVGLVIVFAILENTSSSSYSSSSSSYSSTLTGSSAVSTAKEKFETYGIWSKITESTTTVPTYGTANYSKNSDGSYTVTLMGTFYGKDAYGELKHKYSFTAKYKVDSTFTASNQGIEVHIEYTFH